MRTLRPGRHTGGQRRASHLALEGEPAFWCCSAGTESKLASPLARARGPNKHTFCHTPAAEQTEAGGEGCSSKAAVCLEMPFIWMEASTGAVRRSRCALGSHWSSSVEVLINKQCLRATMHLEGQHWLLGGLDAVCFGDALQLPLSLPHKLGGADVFFFFFLN